MLNIVRRHGSHRKPRALPGLTLSQARRASSGGALVLLLLSGCRANADAKIQEKADPPPVAVQVAEARRLTLHPSIDLIGSLVPVPEHTVAITARIEGQIQQIQVAAGDVVHPGQPLIQLDPAFREVERNRAQAVVAQLEAKVARLKRGYLPQEIEMAQQEVQKAEASTAALSLRVESLRQLRDRGEVSEMEFKKTEASLRAARAEQARAVAQLELYEAGTPAEEMAEATAQLQADRTDLARAELNRAYCTITSPTQGIITDLTAFRGMTVTAGAALATVVDQRTLFARIRLPTPYLSEIRTGLSVDARVAGFGDRVFHGTITRLSGRAESNTGTLDAFALVPNNDALLRAGLSVRVRIWLPELADVLVVPVSAVADRAGTPVVTVIRNSKAYEVEVTVGTQAERCVQITHGLSPGDLVTTRGGYGLPEGTPVRASAGEAVACTDK